MSRPLKVVFFQTETGNEPVRDWLHDLPKPERWSIGSDIKDVQWRWPLGLPLVDYMGSGLWEIRSKLNDRIARIFFIEYDQKLILLHAIIKKSRTTPQQDLKLARRRQSIFTAL